MGFSPVLCLLALATIGCAQASTVVLYDGSRSYLKPAASHVLLRAHDMPVLLAALLRQETGALGQASQQVEAVLSSDLLARPQATIALQVLGAGEDAGHVALASATHVPLKVDIGATDLLKSVAATAGRSFDKIEYVALDHSMLPDSCGDDCQGLLVQEAMLARGLNYTARAQPSLDCDKGAWCYWVESKAGQVLDLDRAADRLWALELGVLRHAALSAASARVLRGRSVDKPQLLEATLVGLQALRTDYGTDSKQVHAAKAMLAGTLQEIWAALNAAHGSKVVMQLSVPETASSSGLPAVEDMLQWRSAHRAVFQRRLLQQDETVVMRDVGTSAFLWASSSVAWLMSIILVAAIIAASVCLCNMSSEQDTLLYASNKAE